MKKTDSSSFKLKRNARNLMHHACRLFLFCCGLTSLSACQSETEETSYPPIITDFAPTHVTLHPRTAKQQYSGELHLAQFHDFYTAATFPVVYNGDITAQSENPVVFIPIIP